MSSLRKMSLASGLGVAAMGLEIPLVTFDNQTGTSFGFTELNDPVMGGQSTGTWNVDSSGHFGIFDGDVVDVPKLKAPGFIKAAADGSFADASGAADGDLVLKVRSTTPEYEGFRVAFVSGAASAAYACSGGGSLPFSRGCFKAKFSVPAGADFTEVRIPFKSFSDKWSPATGEQTATCAAEADVCPSAEKLKGIERMEVWAEGALGKAHLELASISASTSSSSSAVATLRQAPAGAIDLATFDGAASRSWKSENDPVMGGQSSSSFSVKDGYGDYSGTCRIVPKLKAPGFTMALTEFPTFAKTFPDASSADGIILGLRNVGGSVSDFKFAFCSSRMPFKCQFMSFKADFTIAQGEDFSEVFLPWSSFSDKWDAATGKHKGEQPPRHADLKSITQLQLWTEGVEGDFHLQLKYVRAGKAPSTTGTTTSSTPSTPTTTANPAGGVPAAQNTCKEPLQKNLRYNVSSRTEPTVPVAVDPSETLAEAVCCDKRTKVYAEPQFLYQAPDIDLFNHISDSGVTTFYDSACGIPLFKAPVNRTMAEFKADTDEHGWPSFRLAEVLNGNVITDSSGFVYSRCGTHLGSYLPDDKGPRWCMDLVCLAGNPAADTTIII